MLEAKNLIPTVSISFEKRVDGFGLVYFCLIVPIIEEAEGSITTEEGERDDWYGYEFYDDEANDVDPALLDFGDVWNHYPFNPLVDLPEIQQEAVVVFDQPRSPLGTGEFEEQPGRGVVIPVVGGDGEGEEDLFMEADENEQQEQEHVVVFDEDDLQDIAVQAGPGEQHDLLVEADEDMQNQVEAGAFEKDNLDAAGDEEIQAVADSDVND